MDTPAGFACLREDLSRRRLSVSDAVLATLDRIAAVDPSIKAFLDVWQQPALKRAETLDRQIARGASMPLAGIPIAVKDNIVTREGKTTCGSRMLADYRSPYSAHVVERLEAAGAVIVGKTNLDEFAMGSSTEHSAFFPTRNPWNPECVPGGSSGGSAAAVASRMIVGALGSDTGGSVRQPAALCGVTGLKPTYGRVSRFGLVAFGSSLDQIGPLAADAVGCAYLLAAIAGHDPRDSTSIDKPVPDYVTETARPFEPLRIGIPSEFSAAGLDSEIAAAVESAIGEYRTLGCETVPVSLPSTAHGLATYYLISSAEASSNLARFDGVHYGRRTERPIDYIDAYASSRAEGLGDEVKRRIMLGTYALSSGYYDQYYLKALKVRTVIRDEYRAAFQACDVIACPTSPVPAFRLRERLSNPLTMYLADVYTLGASLAGIPAISLPCGFTRAGLPIGLQLLGPHFSEARLLQAAHAYQQATDWHTRVPEVSAA